MKSTPKISTAKESDYHQRVSEVSAKITKVAYEDLDAEINRSLEKVLRPLGVDRGGLLKVFENSPVVRINYAWYDEGFEPISQEINLAEIYPWCYQHIVVQGQTWAMANIGDLPPEAEVDLQSFRLLGSKSVLSIPLFIGQRVHYIFTVNALKAERKWPEEIVTHLRLLGEIFVSALRRREDEQALRQAKERLEEQLQEIERLHRQLEHENAYLRNEVAASREQQNLQNFGERMQEVLIKVNQVASADCTVLIEGETGTGKEVLAQAIHQRSSRANRTMVKVNCAALPAALVESELFGREKGAYTGALSRQVGRFELADGSSLFLDEIGEMPLETQAKLLRVLQEGEFERLGSPKTVKVDVRIIAASNRNLAAEIEQGRFRRDLYYRLNVFPICLPPLRERREDIPLLVWEFVKEFSERMGKKIRRIASRDMELLKVYSWPGNIRELRNVIEHAMIVSKGDTLELERLAVGITQAESALTLAEMERHHINKILKLTDGRVKGVGGAAELLDLNPSTLFSRMRKLGIKAAST